MRYLILGIVIVCLAGAAGPLSSYGKSILPGEVSIEITSDSGSTFRWFPHRDFWTGETHIIKNYLEARKGENYEVVIRNRTSERIGVVIAVDGRNIISGKKSNLRHQESMYLLNGYESGRYGGWRTNRDSVHRFYFTNIADSYAMKTFNDSTAMGVIAVAVYRERNRPEAYYNQKDKEIGRVAPLNESLSRSKGRGYTDDRAGTGFGEEQYSPVINVSFDPEDTPIQKTLIKYEWHEILCQKGIIECRHDPENRLWDEDDYAPYPPGYPQH